MWDSNRIKCFVHCKCLFSCEGVAIGRIREAKSSWDRTRKCTQWRRKGPRGREKGGAFMGTGQGFGLRLLRFYQETPKGGQGPGPPVRYISGQRQVVCGFAPLSSYFLSISDLVGRRRRHMQSHLKETASSPAKEQGERSSCDVTPST